MEAGYSRLLICENVIPNTGAHCEATALDLIMLANFGTSERNERQWRKLIESTRLVVTGIWRTPGNVTSLIECVRG